ncbi:MAG: hypothetical protein IH840_16170 [Candidatus Heimdallarchaeota archaeon]|nr:hypothetical protein [Candidatus Heimdallarchaeota archaeon]
MSLDIPNKGYELKLSELLFKLQADAETGLSESEAKQFSKYELACQVTKQSNSSHLKDSLKAIVTCNL